ncbi:MAG: diaminopimelate epimerase [Actinobacteria bacterium]|nr:diaminopimelate epimerase [Actinomycetota bacterium]
MEAHRTLTKLHGLGNDFLVLVVDGDDPPGDLAAFSRRVCNRHRGVGADGLLVAYPSDSATSWRMELYNADGSRAEMSGNGIRCFAHALLRHTGIEAPVTFDVSTDGGHRSVSVAPEASGDPDTIVAAVTMGRPLPGPTLPADGRPHGVAVTRSATWNLGNPHLVLEVDDPALIDLAVWGPAWEALFPDGMNVHFVTVADSGRVEQVTWERGAGITEACGTGATATALTARAWGSDADHIDVVMPGGTVTVEFADEPILHGPSTWIAEVEVAR